MKAEEFLNSDDCPNIKVAFGLDSIQMSIVAQILEAYAKQSKPSLSETANIFTELSNALAEALAGLQWRIENPNYKTDKADDEKVREWGELLEKYEKQTNWVSVEDRLPEVYTARSSDWVLVLTRDGAQHIATYDHKHKDWDSNSNRGDIVTHWQPLPEPPKQ